MLYLLLANESKRVGMGRENYNSLATCIPNQWRCLCDVQFQRVEEMADAMNVGVNLEAFSQAINAIQALRSSVTRVFDSLKDGMKNKETLEGREKVFITEFQDNLQSVNRDLKWVAVTLSANVS